MALSAALAASILLASRATPASPGAAPSIDDYRYFRALAIDLLGRAPTRLEVEAFERPGFSLDAWIDTSLAGPRYADRLTRIYMDALRLEPGAAVQYSPDAMMLYRVQILGPEKKPVHVYFRAKQRRLRDATDGEFCITRDESGLLIEGRAQPQGEAKPVSKAVLDANTVLVKPWWLYQDYDAPAPTKRINAGWTPPASFKPSEAIVNDATGTPATEVRVCKEEAQLAEQGHVYVTDRKAVPKDAPLPPGRTRQLPLDSAFAKKNRGAVVACAARVGAESSAECGCGVGLERCLPSNGNNLAEPFYFPQHIPLGLAQPLDQVKQNAGRYFPLWWSQEVAHFLDTLWRGDRDMREILNGRWTVVNGPLAQFYRTIQRQNCCGGEANFGMLEETEALFPRETVPTTLKPQDTDEWITVPDRGPHAAGILTMPIYLEKYASGRARGAALYTTFLCKSFIAENAELAPSTENDLTKRPGCSTCHATLEPLAAYFARVEQGNFVVMPQSFFPVQNPTCKRNEKGAINGICAQYYDPAFATASGGVLRGAYASPANADGGPTRAAQDILGSKDFAPCVASRVASSFLGRAMGADDAALVDRLAKVLAANGYRMRPMVRALVHDDAYRRANNMISDDRRGGVR